VCLLAKMSPHSLLSLLLLSICAAPVLCKPRQARQAETDAVTLPDTTTEAKEEMTEIEETEEESVENNEIVTSGEDETKGVQETVDNMDQCHKCRKPSFKYKKVFFCNRCVRDGLVKPAEEEEVHCNKCQRSKYRSRHGEFCEDQCPDTSEETTVTAVETTVADVSTVQEPQAGVLGSLLRYLVQATTWGVPLPQQDQ
jgi:hypothetical protein